MGGGETPGKSMMDFHEAVLAQGARSILTLPAAGFVAKDKKGPVTEAEAAPSPRWVKTVFRKGAAFTATPDASDGEVYSDEFVDLMVKKYGDAGAARGVKSYSIDNGPGLWSATHVRLHPQKATCVELVQRTSGLSDAVKRVDAKAEIFGGVFYGYMDFASLQDAPDWKTLQAASAGKPRPYAWYIDYFLDEMRKASETAGRRLLDVLDVHWYPEARGDNRIVDNAATTPKDISTRMQAPRSLWDSAYVETSWITQYMTQGHLTLLHRLNASIAAFNPGTKIAITEYNYG